MILLLYIYLVLISVERYLAMKHTHAYNTELVKGALLLTCSALKGNVLTGIYFSRQQCIYWSVYCLHSFLSNHSLP